MDVPYNCPHNPKCPTHECGHYGCEHNRNGCGHWIDDKTGKECSCKTPYIEAMKR